MNVQFVGGPHDGRTKATSLGGTYLWFDGFRCFRDPGKGRALYKLTRTKGVWTAMFVGNSVGLCDCGVYRPRREACSLCGSEVLQG